MNPCECSVVAIVPLNSSSLYNRPVLPCTFAQSVRRMDWSMEWSLRFELRLRPSAANRVLSILLFLSKKSTCTASFILFVPNVYLLPLKCNIVAATSNVKIIYLFLCHSLLNLNKSIFIFVLLKILFRFKCFNFKNLICYVKLQS